jgi:hypothetical protein
VLGKLGSTVTSHSGEGPGSRALLAIERRFGHHPVSEGGVRRRGMLSEVVDDPNRQADDSLRGWQRGDIGVLQTGCDAADLGPDSLGGPLRRRFQARVG